MVVTFCEVVCCRSKGFAEFCCAFAVFYPVGFAILQRCCCFQGPAAAHSGSGVVVFCSSVFGLLIVLKVVRSCLAVQHILWLVVDF